MGCRYWVCQKCGYNSLLDKICPTCETGMDMEYDERFYGGPDSGYDNEEGQPDTQNLGDE